MVDRSVVQRQDGRGGRDGRRGAWICIALAVLLSALCIALSSDAVLAVPVTGTGTTFGVNGSLESLSGTPYKLTYGLLGYYDVVAGLTYGVYASSQDVNNGIAVYGIGRDTGVLGSGGMYGIRSDGDALITGDLSVTADATVGVKVTTPQIDGAAGGNLIINVPANQDLIIRLN